MIGRGLLRLAGTAFLSAGLVVLCAREVRARGAPPEAQHRAEDNPSHNTFAAPRIRRTLNDGWRYRDGDVPGAAMPDHDHGGWIRVDLPHTWNRDDAATEALGYRRGPGWYRRSLVLDSSFAGKRVYLHFEGANQVADVHVNGRHAGRHVGGYTAFTVDITALVGLETPNLIAIRVDNSHHPDIPPLNADFTFYGGIYRDVWLIATGPVHITMTDHGSSGIFVETPEVSDGHATVRVRGTVLNETARARRLRIVNRVIDPAGRTVATLSSAIRVAAGASARFDDMSERIARPQLWSPDDPALHRVITEVRDGSAVIDRVESPLGFRWFDFDAQQGFSVNGRRIALHGTNRHQDREGYGNAVPNWVHREDVRLVKQTGFDFLRLAHYPQDPVVLEEADIQGILIWEEIPVVNLITMSDAFDEHAERMLVEMIRQHYNHPSVVMWGYMNEVMLSKPNPIPSGYHERIVALARRLDARSTTEDPTRPTVTAISFEEIDNGTGFQDIPDILGLNLYFGWYYRTLQGLGPWLDSLHQRHPERPIIISEYGADSDERIHARDGRAFDFSAEYQQRFHEETFPQLEARDWLVGTAVWNQFDFGVKTRHDSKPNINQKGLYYFDRKPKDIAFYYQARLTDRPVLRLATRDHPVRAGSREADRAQQIKAYTNLAVVELMAGDSSLGTRDVVNSTVEWTVRLPDGESELRVRGRAGGMTVEDAATVSYADRTPFFGDRPSGVRSFAVNTGSHYAFVDAGGDVWEADREYSPGGWGFVGGEPRLIHHRIFGTNDHPLYQAVREGPESYRFDVPDGTYDVTVRMTEIRIDSAGRRVFSVRVNDLPLFSSIDLAREHGRYVAVERTIRIEVAGGRGIIVRFMADIGLPIVSGIHIRRL